MANRGRHRLFMVHVILTCLVAAYGASEDEANALLKFRDSLSNHTALSNWNQSVSLCNGNTSNWTGLLCSNGVLYGLQLEGMGLTGVIDMDVLTELPDLRIISFMNNSFDGPMPNISKVGALRGLFLSNNRFSGDIPDDAFAGMNTLKKVYLANNEFTGKIPESLAETPKLVELWLQNNQFDGRIPDFQQKGIKVVNLANNKLEGPIPASLSNMSSTFFAGNINLCGKPLDPCKPSKKHKFRKISQTPLKGYVI